MRASFVLAALAAAAGCAHAVTEHALLRVSAWVPTACEIRAGDADARAMVRMRCLQATLVAVSIAPTTGGSEPSACRFILQDGPGARDNAASSPCVSDFAQHAPRDVRVTATF